MSTPDDGIRPVEGAEDPEERRPAVVDGEAHEIGLPDQRPRRRKRRPEPEPPIQYIEQRSIWPSCGTFVGISLLVIVLVFGAIALAFTNEVTDFFDDPVDNLLEMVGIDRGNSTPEVVDARVVVLGIQELAVIETTRADILVDETVVQEKTFVLRDARLRVQYSGRVTAGVDLSLIEDGDVIVEGPERVTINLPPAQITGCYLRDPEILENTCGTNVLGMANCSDTYETLQQTAYNRAMSDLLDTAQEQDVTGLAIASAESAISDLMKNLGITEITFNRSTDTLPPDDSCMPGS
ncbi:MAG TPA: DUF4230 domain-containing protein [Aggregatilinea sp.]|uniref:DUF4230 domain-containing protein n=1 Tax=Aggregatilinea sp. TaxID=2806333 RepID=UPI002C9CA79E|nr:DUF4230 domain-containing protein [Aggregatilinea sp.]HML22209.1 DUF4230 domain-containing protein [Aggregatilinea sp.]